MNYSEFLLETNTKKINYKKIKFPSKLSIEYLKKDKEQNKYLDKLIKDFEGEIIIDIDKNKLIGNIFINCTKEKGFITNLIVQKEYRRQGFGSMLLKDAIDKYNAIDLTVDIHNINAIKMYEKYGFKKINLATAHRKNDSWYMKII